VSSNRRKIAARRRNPQAGSQNDSEPVFVVVGIGRRPHGLRGEMLVQVISDDPERLQPGANLTLGPQHLPVTINSARQHNQGLLIAFEEYPTREAIEPFRNVPLYVHVDELPALAEGEFYAHQLVGLQVVDEAGQDLGRLVDVLETGANDVYVVHSATGAELLLPAIEDVILKIDLENGQVRVRLLPGMEIPD
jgi:16S rRNA processing protein RimM